MPRACATNLGALLFWRSEMTIRMQRLMIDLRLGDGRTTGKIAARNAVRDRLRNHMQQALPELVGPVFVDPVGTAGWADPVGATLDVLQTLYLTGVTHATTPAPAFLNITRRVVYVADVTLPSLAERAAARIAEVAFEQAETNATELGAYPGLSFNVTTVKQVSAWDMILGVCICLPPMHATTRCQSYDGCR